MLMRLYEKPFLEIMHGTRHHEIRLYDEKRQKLREGHKIVFICKEYEHYRITVTVTDLTIKEEFKDLVYSIGELDLLYDIYPAHKIDTSDKLRINFNNVTVD